MTDLHDEFERAFVRRSRPDPILEELARQAVDALVTRGASNPTPYLLGLVAGEFGVPIAYILDERERRVREQGRESA